MNIIAQGRACVSIVVNRPKYAAPAGMLEEADKEKLATQSTNAILELQALAAGQRVQDLVADIADWY